MMKQLGLAAFAWAVAFSGWTVPGAWAAEKKADGKVRVVIIDGQNNHNWRATTPFMKKALEDSGRFAVSVSTTPQPGGKAPEGKDAVTFPPDLDRYDVVLSNYNGAPWPAEFQKALE